jgi:hypothetical protein
MKNFSVENLNNWKYENNDELSLMENLKQEHDQYDKIQNIYQEGIVQATIKMGEIYIKAKDELLKEKSSNEELPKKDKKVTNQEIGNYFGKSEATVRNYIKIANNRNVIFETHVSETLSVRNMIAIIDGRAKQKEDGSVEKKAKEKLSKEESIARKNEQIKELRSENQKLKILIQNYQKLLGIPNSDEGSEADEE